MFEKKLSQIYRILYFFRINDCGMLSSLLLHHKCIPFSCFWTQMLKDCRAQASARIIIARNRGNVQYSCWDVWLAPNCVDQFWLNITGRRHFAATLKYSACKTIEFGEITQNKGYCTQARSQDFSLGGCPGLKNCRYPPMGVESGERQPLPRKFLEFYHCTDYILEHFNALLNWFFLKREMIRLSVLQCTNLTCNIACDGQIIEQRTALFTPATLQCVRSHSLEVTGSITL